MLLWCGLDLALNFAVEDSIKLNVTLLISIHYSAFKCHLRSFDYCVFLFLCTSITVENFFTFASLFKLC